ncbi:MAG: cell division protein FtsA [Kiritimatiellae bacterium]|nr:cell division protein FtsA [Kiritimatiellia bacterium]
MSSLNAVLELGTSNTVLAIGEMQQDGRVKIITHCRIPSVGVRKSKIINLEQVKKSIGSVLRESEKLQLKAGSKITLGNAFLIMSGTHVRTSPLVGTATIARQKVTDAEITEAQRSLRSFGLPPGREVIDIYEQGYDLDGIGGIDDPKGMSGSVLKVHALLVDADADRINDARSAADSENLELRDPLFSVMCAADAVLEERDRIDGSIVIDCGGGTTGYAVFLNGQVVTAGTIGVGGDHITNDIAYAFQTTQSQAEALKIEEASALPTVMQGASARVKMPGDSPLVESRTISRKALNTVTNARLRELLTILREKLSDLDLLHRLHAGAILVGGGAKMRDLPQLVTQTLGTVTRIGVPLYVDGLENEPDPERLAAVAGALMYVQRNYEEKSIFDFFKGIFK